MADQFDGIAVLPEINVGRRAFPMAQELFAGSPSGAPQALTCGWHDATVNPETGAFALVQAGAGLDDLIGEIVEVTSPTGSVLVYVLQAAPVAVQFSLYRRAWTEIALLSADPMVCRVVTVQ